MKDLSEEKSEALVILEKFTKKTSLSEKEIEDFSLKLGKKVNNK